MKKLLLVLCIAFAGNVYGQLDGLNRGIKESVLKDEQLFDSESLSFNEYFLNLGDYIKEQVKINNRASLNRVVVGMSISMVVTDMTSGIQAIKNLELIYYSMLKNGCPSYVLTEFMKTHIQVVYNNAESALELIISNEGIFNGTHAQNILNMKRDLRKLKRKCSELLFLHLSYYLL